MIYAQTRICSRKWDSDFEIQTDHLILAWRSNLELFNNKYNPYQQKKKKKKKMKTWHVVDFTIPANHREKIKESKKMDP